MAVFAKMRRRLDNIRLSMRMKITLSLSAIAVILLTSSVISFLEYTRMSDYVSQLIAGNIHSINVAQNLATVADAYNLEILAVIGDDGKNIQPAFDRDSFMARCDSLRGAMRGKGQTHLADSVEYSYAAYMLTSLELQKVLQSDFIDSRTWYFERLQPVYGRLRSDIDALSGSVYDELVKNSATFDRGFYRSAIPGAVAVSVGILLILLLLFYLLAYYVNPVYKMLASLDSYRGAGTSYNAAFDGDDQLVELSEGISEVTEENRQLRKRIKALRSTLNSSGNTDES